MPKYAKDKIGESQLGVYWGVGYENSSKPEVAVEDIVDYRDSFVGGVADISPNTSKRRTTIRTGAILAGDHADGA